METLPSEIRIESSIFITFYQRNNWSIRISGNTFFESKKLPIFILEIEAFALLYVSIHTIKVALYYFVWKQLCCFLVGTNRCFIYSTITIDLR